ncbi:MAG TPA: serine/threonine-protein kinase, partial [Gemmata sp.]|nr:serine/threonine-protein kinase [Gemmata sp.]
MTPLDDRDPVDVLAEEFVDRLRRGEHPSVSDYAAANPDHAEQLRELLPAVAQMECLKKFRRATGLAADTPQLPDRFGDFRIVRELGRGGMGVVFEAVQESLGRPVALKVLATHSQFDVVRHERFIREAHAAARLHHTNIVPVFGVGEQDSIPYYVMQLIRGQGLNAVAQRWRREKGRCDESAYIATPLVADLGSAPTPMTIDARNLIPQANPNNGYETAPVTKYGNWRFVAEVGLQAAEALHYAHKQGVLHRDIKPANLLLDSANRVWITDFGLAKLIDRNGLTASGDILGTLQYLAPECLTGDSDPRSDVYGVGATLYELLTLTPPYPTDAPARLIKQVAETDPVPPRQINPDIPVELETIVLMAMAREPDRRYVSAREFARDLQAYLEDRPIKARRQKWTNRMWRLCRKNKAITALSGTAIAALLLAGVMGWVAFAKTNRELEDQATKTTEADKARREADDARNEAEKASKKLAENLQLSLKAFEAVFNAASGSRQGYGIAGWFRSERPVPVDFGP